MKLMAILIHVQGFVNNKEDWVRDKAKFLMRVANRHDRIRTQSVYIVLKMM
jgi:hypothetical protein